jgi:hypothetical protein
LVAPGTGTANSVGDVSKIGFHKPASISMFAGLSAAIFSVRLTTSFLQEVKKAILIMMDTIDLRIS